MRVSALLASSALLAMSVGCLQSVDYVDPVQTDIFANDRGDLNFDVRDARLSGQYGATETFDNATATASGYDDGSTTNLVLETRRGNDLGMLIIDTWGSSLRTMPAGRYTSSSTTMDGEVAVSVCATDFDAPASDAELVIEDRPDGARVVTVEATVDGEYGVDNRENPAIAQFTVTR